MRCQGWRCAVRSLVCSAAGDESVGRFAFLAGGSHQTFFPLRLFPPCPAGAGSEGKTGLPVSVGCTVPGLGARAPLGERAILALFPTRARVIKDRRGRGQPYPPGSRYVPSCQLYHDSTQCVGSDTWAGTCSRRSIPRYWWMRCNF